MLAGKGSPAGAPPPAQAREPDVATMTDAELFAYRASKQEEKRIAELARRYSRPPRVARGRNSVSGSDEMDAAAVGFIFGSML